jgi:chromosome segregation ATPase
MKIAIFGLIMLLVACILMPYNHFYVDTFVDTDCDMRIAKMESEKIKELNNCLTNTQSTTIKIQTKDNEINNLRESNAKCSKEKNELDEKYNKLRKDYEAIIDQATSQQKTTTNSNDQVTRLQTMLRQTQAQFTENNKQYMSLQENYNKLAQQYKEVAEKYKTLADEFYIKCYDYRLSIRPK